LCWSWSWSLRWGLDLLLLEDLENLGIDRRRCPNCWNILSCFCTPSSIKLVMETPRITMTDAMMSPTQDSTINQYASHNGAAPVPVSVVSVVSINDPTTLINVQMIITVERPSNTAIDGFRENDIIESFRTIMGMLTTRKISI
jgi:hypothetical protein